MTRRLSAPGSTRRWPPQSGTARRRLLGSTLLLLLCWLAPLSGAAAHTDLLQGSPGPAQRTGGTVDFIDLIFVEPVSNAVVTVEDPNGIPVAGTTTVADGQIIRFEMPALTETGRYIVRYTMDSADGDATEAAYFFTYHPDGTQPTRLGDVDAPDNTANVVSIVASVVFLLCMIGLVMVFLTRLERRRAAAAAEPSDLKS